MDPVLGLISVESAPKSRPENLIPSEPDRVRSLRIDSRSAEPTPTRSTSTSLTGSVAETAVPESQRLRGGKAFLLTIQLTLSMMLNSFVTGVMTITITVIGSDLGLDPSLVFWPVLAYTLVSSPLMLPFGSVADVLGSKPLNLLGCLVCGLSVLCAGFTRTGVQLIVARCLQGFGAAMSLPTSMSIISSSLAPGKFRNVALSCLGMGQVVGFGFGLVLSGIFVETIGWRFSFWLCGGMQIALFGLGLYAIPTRKPEQPEGASISQRLKADIDWVGAFIACACIGMLSYVLAMIAESTGAIKEPSNIALLTLSLLAMPAFSFWMSFQERRARPALIPNSLWKTTFVSLCLMVTFANAEMQCMEFLTSLFFQNVQQLSVLESSVRLLPGLVVGTLLNLTTGSLVHKISIPYFVTGACLIAAASPLIMALINPSLPYWYEAFPAQTLYPVSIDTIYVVGALIVSDVFPERDQALAGAVFNTIANLGQAIGLAIIAVISNTVSQNQPDPETPSGLLEGYRAGFFTAFAWMIITALVAVIGFRNVGRIGIKRD